MTDKKITELIEDLTPALTDFTVVVNGSGINEKVTLFNVGKAIAYFYLHTMLGDEVLPYFSPLIVCDIAPNGAIRNLDPDSAFAVGSLVLVYNEGPHAITFDSTGLGYTIGAGERALFTFNGTDWE